MSETAFLVEIEVTPAGSAVAQKLHLSDTAVPPFAPTDPDRPSQPYDPRVLDAANVERGLDLETLSADAGGGAITISNNDGALDLYRSYTFGAFAVYRGQLGSAFADYEPVMSGQCGSPEFGRSAAKADQLTIPVFDPRTDLANDIQSTFYAGTNAGGGSGYEGTADDLKDRPKPIGLGNLTRANVPAIWANAADLVAQLHDGKAQEVNAIYNGGGDAALTPIGDFVGTAFDAATPGATEFATDLGRGLVKFGAALAGGVTFDLKGNADPLYVEDAPSLITKELVTAGIAGEEISDDFVNIVAPEPVGVWLNEPTPVSEVVDFLARSIGAVCSPDRLGKWRLVSIAPPTVTPLVTFNADDLVENATGGGSLGTPTWRVTIRYARNYQVMTGADLQGSVIGTDREGFLAQEWRTAISSDQTTKDRWPTAVERTFETGLVDEADAAALAARLLALFGPRSDGTAREVVDIQTPLTDEVLALDLGDTVRIGDGIDRNFIVTRILPTQPARHMVTLELFG